jgi:hypothetical protein
MSLHAAINISKIVTLCSHPIDPHPAVMEKNMEGQEARVTDDMVGANETTTEPSVPASDASEGRPSAAVGRTPEDAPLPLTAAARLPGQSDPGAEAAIGPSVPAVRRAPLALPAVTAAGVATSVALPRQVAYAVYPPLRQALKILTRRLPVIAGQRVEDYFQMLELALWEFSPQEFSELNLVKQLADAVWEILTLQTVQTWLMNSAIGAEFLAILNGLEDGSEHSQKAERTQALKAVVFAALAGDAEAVRFLEEHTGRSVAMGPDTPAALVPTMPLHVFADRAITTRLARRDAAYRELSRIKEERRQLPAGFISTADIRRQLPLSEYIKLLADVDIYKQAEPALFKAAKEPPPKTISEPSLAKQLVQETLERRAAAAKAAAEQAGVEGAVEPSSAPSSSGEQVLREAQAPATDPVSVHAPIEMRTASSQGEANDDVTG